jgi:acetylornithine deacetylase/succinyl-diaminopimelate desuccinylase-like protein
VIPAAASAKISLRLVPDQRPGEVAEQVASAIASACPPGATAKFIINHAAPPSLVDRGNPFLAKAAQAMEEVFGHPTAYIRCGGSIPIVNLLLQKLGISTVLPGFGLPDDQIHAPNEKLRISNYIRGISCMVRYYDALSGANRVSSAE